MKILKYLTGYLLALSLPLAAASPSVSIDVKIKGEVDFQGKGNDTNTQSRTLTTTIANYGNEAVPELKVKWWVFGHNMTDRKLVISKQGESKVVIPSEGKVDVTSPEVKITGTREHKVTSGKGRGKSSRKTTKTVPASGQQYYGYAVEVYSGDTLVSSKYSHPGIKEELNPR